jgi:hypothetical protein
MAEGRVSVHVASPAVVWLADVAGVLLVPAAAVTGLAVHAFWTWLLGGLVAAMLVAFAGRLAAQASLRGRRRRPRARAATLPLRRGRPGP